jgi:hypothetical protein
MERLQFQDAGEVTVNGTGKGLSVDSEDQGILPCRFGIVDGADRRRARCNVAEGVDQVSQLGGHSALLQRGHRIAGIPHVPFLEITSKDAALIALLRRHGRCMRTEK